MATKGKKGGQAQEPHCSFCGRGQSEVEVMFRGVDHANICNNCIDDGFATMVKAGVKVKATGVLSPKGAAAKSKAVSMSDVPKPKEIKERPLR